VHVRGGSLVATIDLLPDASQLYAPQQFAGGVFVEGDTLELSADGAQMPAFREQLTAPPPVAVTSPDLAHLDLRRGQPIAVRWTAGGASSFNIIFTVIAADNRELAYGVCSTADDGEHDVPAAATAFFPAPSGTQTMVAQRSSSKLVSAGRYHVSVAAWSMVSGTRTP
jgi:hypothetical protein